MIAGASKKVKTSSASSKVRSVSSKSASTKKVGDKKVKSASIKKIDDKKVKSASTKKVDDKKVKSASTKKSDDKKVKSASTKKVGDKKVKSASKPVKVKSASTKKVDDKKVKSTSTKVAKVKTGSKSSDSPLNTADAQKSYCSCLMKVRPSKKGINPYSVCTKTVLWKNKKKQPKKCTYDFGKYSIEELKSFVDEKLKMRGFSKNEFLVAAKASSSVKEIAKLLTKFQKL
jgi:hypothetical protein